MDGLPVGRGDVIQTRKNNTELRVANRQTWTVQHVEADGTVWACEAGRGPGAGRHHRRQQRTVRLPAAYVEKHAHLAYAATAYGVQGTTAATAHTVLSGGLDAAGVYVGMTRGRHQNILHVVAGSVDEAREQFTLALERDRADRGLDAATTQAGQDVAGLVDGGPVKLVNTEKTRLTQLIERAEANQARWQQAAEALTNQRHEHQTAYQAQQVVVQAADARLAQVRAATLEPLLVRALADGQTLNAARKAMYAATEAARMVGRSSHRATGRAAKARHDEYQAVEEQVGQTWGSSPMAGGNTQAWAENTAKQAAETTPTVVAAQQDHEAAKSVLSELLARQDQEREVLNTQVYGAGTRPGGSQDSAHGRAVTWRQRASEAQAELTRIEVVPVAEAARRIKQRNAAQAQAQTQSEVEPAGQTTKRQTANQAVRPTGSDSPDMPGPVLGL